MTEARTSGLEWLGILTLMLVLANLAGFGLLHWIPPCPLRRLTGLLCPVCGSSHAVIHLARAEWAEAWRSNAPAVLGVVVWGTVSIGRASLGERWPTIGAQRRRVLTIAGVVALLAYGVARNL
jgi:hypothetical protein